ncbi:unnamed protein product, partial [Phaeothamnion confervicola]
MLRISAAPRSAMYMPTGRAPRQQELGRGARFRRSGTATLWRAKLQDCVAASTCEAEYVAAAYAAQHAVWLRHLASCLGLEVSSATLLHEDNLSCVALENNAFSEHRVKHIDIKFHIVQERVASGATTVVPTKADDQLADLLTQPFPVPRACTLQRKTL